MTGGVTDCFNAGSAVAELLLPVGDTSSGTGIATGSGRLGAKEFVEARIDSRLFGGSGGGLLVLRRSAETGLLISGVAAPEAGALAVVARSGDNRGPLRSGDSRGPFLSGDNGLALASATAPARGIGGD